MPDHDFVILVRGKGKLRYRQGVAKKHVEVIFRDTHNQEWTCGYCKQIATTIRQGVAVCPQHKHLWTLGAQPTSPPVPAETPANH